MYIKIFEFKMYASKRGNLVVSKVKTCAVVHLSHATRCNTLKCFPKTRSPFAKM